MQYSITRKVSLIITIVLLLVSLVGCGTQTAEPVAQKDEEVVEESVDVMEGMTLTLDELSKFDGKDGNPAYIAVDGVIYDVSKIPQWAGGMHRGFSAGKDVTAEVNSSPHGAGKLSGAPVVGKISE